MMKSFPVKRAIILLISFFVVLKICDAQQYKRSIRNPERQLFGKSLNNKTVKYRESREVVRAKKKQAANQKRLDKEYYAYVKKQRKHNIDIQSPEVKARMIENRKDSDQRFRDKKKNIKEKSRKAGRKYD
ncbi:MAG: hypothetical protein GX431_01965 [Bacteroidales bacterium]|jgi:hypothetical protein|nr:hypothetical protein [Bacteroidales bacterium]